MKILNKVEIFIISGGNLQFGDSTGTVRYDVWVPTSITNDGFNYQVMSSNNHRAIDSVFANAINGLILSGIPAADIAFYFNAFHQGGSIATIKMD